ncbi:MAG TPA: hypothetical protein DCR98_10115, partial [Cobetia sp.]|nr:hypothetical protein [Cobetia sp.]
MALTDRAVELVLKAKNLISPSTEAAADSVSDLSANAEELRSNLDQLEDQRGLVRAFQQATTATGKAQKEWDKAADKVRVLEQEIEASGQASVAQQNRLNEARAVAARAGAAYEQQAAQAAQLGQSLTDAGINTGNLSEEQLRLAREAREAQNALNGLGSSAAQAGDQAERSESRFRKAGASLQQWAAGAAAAAVAGVGLAVGWATRYTAQQAEMAQQLDITSRSLGISTQALQGYQYAFQRAGIDADKTADIFKDTADKIGDAYQNGGGEAQDALEALGIKAEELIELAPDEMMLRLADAMQDLPQAAQVNLLESLADDATRLQPLLADNAAELRALMAEADQVGLIMSPEQIANLQATNAAIERLQGRLQGVGNRLLGELSPAVNQVSADLEQALAENTDLLDDLATAIGGVIRASGEWVTSFIQQRDQIVSSMQTIIDTAQFLGNTIKGVFQSVNTSLSVAKTYWASYKAGALSATEFVAKGLNKVRLVSDEAFSTLSAKASSARESVKELASDTWDYAKSVVQSGKDAANAFDNSETAAEKAAAAAAKARAEEEAAALAAKRRAEEEEKAAKQAADAAAKRQKALENAATSLGTSLGELSSGISDSEQEALDAFATLAASGELSAAQLATAFDKAQDKIKSDKGIAALKDQVDGLVNDGVTGADALATKWKSAGARLAKDMGTTLEEIRTGITEAERSAIDAFTKIASTGELSAKELSRAYVGAKEQISSDEGIKAFGAVLDGLVKDGVTGARTLKAQWIEAQEATAKAARDTGDKAQQASADTARTVEASVTRSAQTIAQLMSNALHETEEQMRSLSDAAYQAFATDWG